MNFRNIVTKSGQRQRSLPLIVTIGLWALVATTLAVVPTTQNRDAGALSGGVTFGAYAQPVGGQSNIDAFVALENKLGRKLPMIRGFALWNDGIGADKPLHTWARDGGRQVMVSVKPKRNGARIDWRDIANAQPGSGLWQDMARLASGARRFGEPMIVAFHHEPEASTRTQYGDHEDYKAAYRKFVEVFRAEGANNVSFAWVMTSWAFEVGDYNSNDRRRASIWYPGDDVVDFIAADPYNWGNCRNSNEPWTSLERTIEPLMRFARQHPDKKLILAEWGSIEGGSGQKAAWLDDARNMFKSGEHKDKLAAVLYFHDDHGAEGFPACNWWLDSSNQTLDAARRFLDDGFFRARVPLGGNNQPPPPPTTTTTTAAPTTTTTTTTTTAAPRPRPTTTTTTTTAAPRPRPTTTTTTTAAPRPAAAPSTAAPSTTVATPPTTAEPRAGAPAAGPNQPAQPPADTSLPRCFGHVATIVGTDGNDVLRGTNGLDVIVGLGGNDRIYGADGADLICAGEGRDIVWGNGGADRIAGDDGRDRLYGGQGTDRLYGGRNRDVLNGSSGRDHMYGGPGADRLYGGRQSDNLEGEGGNDRLRGNAGSDRLDGGASVDSCVGGGGRDVIMATCEVAAR